MLRICYQSSRSFRDASSLDIKKIDFSFTDIYVNEVYPCGYECRLHCKNCKAYILIRSNSSSEIVGYINNIYHSCGKNSKQLNFIVDD